MFRDVPAEDLPYTECLKDTIARAWPYFEQEAYNEGLAYAKDRAQFGKKIVNFPAVYDMLSRMKAKLDAGRSLL